MRRVILISALLVSIPGLVWADCPVGVSSAADQLTGHINGTQDYAQTYCIASSEPIGCSIVCFTATRLTSLQETARWLVVGEDAVRRLSARGRQMFDYLYMADRGLIDQNLSLRVPTQRAFDAQSQASTGFEGERVTSTNVWDRFSLQSLPPLQAPDIR